ncbi:MAG TPA: aldehyde dehydrogenase family protein [Candidatus Hydrogenedentes bacterium]|nr:aldehyde dehydrogenase family protein [Candidatus Hydrogenedentota bacterium]
MSAKELNVINPFTEEVAFTLPMLNEEEIDTTVAHARTAFAGWKNTPMAERKALCEGFMKVFDGMRDEIAKDLTLQMGKPLQQSRNEVNGMLERTRYMIDIAEETLKDEYLPEKPCFTRYIRHEPKGVVLDIAAWNYPLLIAVNVVAPAVLAGNAVIIKHSSKTPLCARAFTEAFAKAGAPKWLVQDIVADHHVTDLFIKHPGINHVSFTGSVRGGHEVVQSATNRFIDVGLELGGKDPAYVCADAPFDFSVDNCVDGAFYNAGQSCCAIERVYVDKAIYRNFVDAYAALVRKYNVGDPMNSATSIGPLASKGAPEFLAWQVKDAVEKGGKLLVSPEEFGKQNKGYFSCPAVVIDAPQDCSLVQEESFGPVIAIIPVSGDEEAIRLMNDSPYGLTASIWTMDPQRAIRVGEQIETGTFFMNRCDYLDPALPWTGVKDTGRGATLSHYGLLNLTQIKSMHLRVELPK